MASGTNVTLRTRVVIATIVTAVALVGIGLIVYVQYSLTSVVAQAVHDDLSPASDAAAALMLAQANASGDLSDYVLLDRPASLVAYRASIAQASALLDQIEATLPDTVTDLRTQVNTARAAQNTWVTTDAEPSITLASSGKQGRATRTTNSAESWQAYQGMTNASTALNRAVNDERDTAAEALASVNSLLGATLAIIGILILIGVLVFLLGLHQWVLRPLSRLRSDLQEAASIPGHEAPIAPVGPPELRDVATDAEQLRRNLVQEIDEARAAREGLEQDAPLVAAMEAELTAPAPVTPGLAVYGVCQSAEGVMAGDWWDAVARPGGGTAIVVADVSGHGPAATVTALRVRAILRSALGAGLPLAMAVEMSAASCADDTHFVTAIIVELQPATGRLIWVNAGHHPAIVVDQHRQAYLCDPTGPLISSLGGSWTEGQGAFGPHDVVVAYTDGLVESRNSEGDELESSAVAQLVRALDPSVRTDPTELVARLLADVRHRAADWRKDDVTVVAVSSQNGAR